MHAIRGVSRFAAVLAVVVGAMALAACDVVVTGINARGKAQDDWSKTYQIAANGQVEILNISGEIDVTGGDAGQVEVRAERIARAGTDEAARDFLKQVEIREDVGTDHVRLETRVPSNLEGKHAEVRYHLKVPASISLRVRNTNGQVTLTGLKGRVQAETTNGGVRGLELTGPVQASTTNGGVRLELAAVADGGVRAETTNGGVEVTIPASAKANVRASCTNGGIHVSGLNLEGGETSRRRVEGRLNGGGPTVALETTNGGIRLSGK